MLGPIAIGLALLSALATFLVLTGLTQIVPMAASIQLQSRAQMLITR